MQQTDKGALVQQRIKKMLESKKRNLQRDSGDTKRLKSGAADKNPLHEEDDQLGKPQSSLRMRRPVSAFKAAESTNSITTATTIKPEIDPKPHITTAFQHGVKLIDFLKEHKLDPNKHHDYLINSQLFLLSTIARLKQIPQDRHSAVVEKECMSKIGRQLQVREQLRRCEEAESRIARILDDRIRTLSNHAPL